jgi:hypothetical protein
LWVADQVSENTALVAAIGPAAGSQRRGVKITSYALPRGTRPSSLAFYSADAVPALHGNLLIASDEGQHLLRIQFDSREPTRVLGTERLLRNAIGGIRSIAISKEGRIYLATSDALATVELAAGVGLSILKGSIFGFGQAVFRPLTLQTSGGTALGRGLSHELVWSQSTTR